MSELEELRERVTLLNALALRAMGHGFKCFSDEELLAIDFGNVSTQRLALENMHGQRICALVAMREGSGGNA